MQKSRISNIADIVFIALAAAVIAICSWISIPIGEIPVTLQTFAVFAAVGILGTKKSIAAVLVWIFLGAVGVPVFSGFRGGIGAILGATGGYMVGFIFLALIGGLIIDKFGKKIHVMYLGLILGLIVCYAFGTAWYMLVYMKNTGTVGLLSVLGMCVFPYIIPDLIKLALAVTVAEAVSKTVSVKI